MRLSTVYDLSGLKLYSNGKRVQPHSSTFKRRTSKPAVQDSRGNWIAKDAGGSGIIPKSKIVDDSEVDDNEESFDLDNVAEDSEEEPTDAVGSSTRKGKAPNTSGQNGSKRPNKRRKLEEDPAFLDDARRTGLIPVISSLERITSPSFPLPSSDLLKCIHHYACTYYTERGQLFNASKAYRREKKLRRLARSEKARQKQSISLSVASNEQGGNKVKAKDTSDQLSSGEDLNSESEMKSNREADSRREPKQERKKKMRKDMYKIMDGSALLAIGVLVQEYIGQLLTPTVPEGWDDLQYEVDDPEDSGETKEI